GPLPASMSAACSCSRALVIQAAIQLSCSSWRRARRPLSWLNAPGPPSAANVETGLAASTSVMIGDAVYQLLAAIAAESIVRRSWESCLSGCRICRIDIDTSVFSVLIVVRPSRIEQGIVWLVLSIIAERDSPQSGDREGRTGPIGHGGHESSA